MQQPRQSDVGRGLAQLVAQGLVGLELLAVLGDPLLGALRGAAALLLLAQDPGQQTALQRAPGDDAHAVGLAGGQDLQLDGALQQVVDALLAGQAREVTGASCLLGLGDVPAREVRRARVEHLALGDEGLHRLPDLVPRRVAVDVVELVQVDVVGLQPPQRRFAGPPDVQRGQEGVVGPVVHRPVQLRGDHRLLAPTAALGEPASDDLLGPALPLAPPVHVGRVEEVDAGLVGGVHDREGVLLGGLRAEVHRAEAQSADRQAGAAQVGVLHGFS